MKSKLTRSLLVILGGAVALGASAAAAAEFRFVEGAGYMDLLYGDAPVYRHITPTFNPAKHAETFKVFHHISGFHGEGFLTKGVGGEFTHHRGQFLGWSVTKTAGKTMDSWHGGNGSSIRHAKYLPERELTGAKARRASVSEWTEKDGTVLVRDTREVTAWFEEAGKLYLDWALTIASASGDSVTLDGDPQHAGFQFRADSLITAFEYLGPADKTGTGDVWTMKNANSWAVNMFALKGHKYAVMQMDHPLNPRPVVVSHRDYGRFGHYFTATVPKDKPVTFHFRTLVLDVDKFGSPTQAQAQVLYDAYAKDASVAISVADPQRRIAGARAAASAWTLAAGAGGNWLRAREPRGLNVLEAYGLLGRSVPAGSSAAAGALILRETSR
jgi:hypothetical protein